jgi:hypothetical protein
VLNLLTDGGNGVRSPVLQELRIRTQSRHMCTGSNDRDALAQRLDLGIGVVGVLRLVGLVRNEGMDLRGWDD